MPPRPHHALGGDPVRKHRRLLRAEPDMRSCIVRCPASLCWTVSSLRSGGDSIPDNHGDFSRQVAQRVQESFLLHAWIVAVVKVVGSDVGVERLKHGPATKTGLLAPNHSERDEGISHPRVRVGRGEMIWESRSESRAPGTYLHFVQFLLDRCSFRHGAMRPDFSSLQMEGS